MLRFDLLKILGFSIMIGSCTPFHDWIQLTVSYPMIEILILMKISISPLCGTMGDVHENFGKSINKTEIGNKIWKSE